MFVVNRVVVDRITLFWCAGCNQRTKCVICTVTQRYKVSHCMPTALRNNDARCTAWKAGSTEGRPFPRQATTACRPGEEAWQSLLQQLDLKHACVHQHCSPTQLARHRIQNASEAYGPASCAQLTSYSALAISTCLTRHECIVQDPKLTCKTSCRHCRYALPCCFTRLLASCGSSAFSTTGARGAAFEDPVYQNHTCARAARPACTCARVHAHAEAYYGVPVNVLKKSVP